MPIITVPSRLREKLGDAESDQLVSIFEKVADEQKNHLFETLEKRFIHKVEFESHILRTEFSKELQALRTEVKEEIQVLRTEVKEEIQVLRTEMKEEQHSLRIELKAGVHDLRVEMLEGFTEMQKQFGEMQKQITRQSQWMIGLIGFLAISLKVLDLIFK